MPFELSKQKAYWFCQIFGWGAFVVYELVNQIGLGFFNLQNIVFVLLAAPSGIGVTHAYRALLRRWRVLDRSFMTMIPLALVAVFGLSFCMFVLLALASAIFSGQSPWEGFSPNYVFMSVLNWSRYLFVWVLIYHLVGLMERINGARLESLAFENQLKNVELQNLKAQLNPHFLFNALNSIKALTHSDPRRAGDAVTLLSDLLRYSLNYEKNTFVPLSDELAVVRDYLALEKIRFNQRLEYRLDIDPATEHWPIPPIMLVTLAENAIKHGIAQLVKGGLLTIRTRVEREFLVIEVQNSGKFAPDLTRQGIGLSNIDRRLEMLFAGKASFNICNTDPDTVQAVLQLPAS